jgi:hypothetical protein
MFSFSVQKDAIKKPKRKANILKLEVAIHGMGIGIEDEVKMKCECRVNLESCAPAAHLN